MLERGGGRSVERLAALSDGIFAIAMTLLVLDLQVPAKATIHDEAGLRSALLVLAPRLVIYCMSFVSLGTFWLAQQIALQTISRSHRRLTWNHLTFLLFISLMPFSTSLLAELKAYQGALLVYAANAMLAGLALHIGARNSERLRLTDDEAALALSRALRHRLVVMESVYGVAIVVSFFHPYWSVATILVVQLLFLWRGAALPGVHDEAEPEAPDRSAAA